MSKKRVKRMRNLGPRYSVKDKSMATLNNLLNEYAKKKDLKNMRTACIDLNIPTSSAKVSTKQISGYIGFVKSKLK